MKQKENRGSVAHCLLSIIFKSTFVSFYTSYSNSKKFFLLRNLTSHHPTPPTGGSLSENKLKYLTEVNLKNKGSWADDLFGSAAACRIKRNTAKYQSYDKSRRKRLCFKLLLADWPLGY